MDTKCCPSSHLGLHSDVSMMILDYRIRSCEAQAAACLLRCEKRVKDSMKVFLWYTYPLILNTQSYVCA